MAEYKKTKKGGGRTLKYMNIGIDADLLPVLDKVDNKTRFINQAIREYVNNMK